MAGCSSCGDPFKSLSGPRPAYDGSGQLIGAVGVPDQYGICPNGDESKITAIVQLNDAAIGSYVIFCFDACSSCAANYTTYSQTYQGYPSQSLDALAAPINAIGNGASADVVGNVLYISLPYWLLNIGDRINCNKGFPELRLCAIDASDPMNPVPTYVSYDLIKPFSCECEPQPQHSGNQKSFTICLNNCTDAQFQDKGDYPIGASYNYKLNIYTADGSPVFSNEGSFVILQDDSVPPAITLPTLPDASYRVVYEVYDAAGTLIMSTTRFFVYDCGIRCCYQNLVNRNSAAKCSQPDAIAMTKIWALMRGYMDRISCVNSMEEANRMILTAKKICKEVKCSC